MRRNQKVSNQRRAVDQTSESEATIWLTSTKKIKFWKTGVFPLAESPFLSLRSFQGSTAVINKIKIACALGLSVVWISVYPYYPSIPGTLSNSFSMIVFQFSCKYPSSPS
jgi:hypothetical protein